MNKYKKYVKPAIITSFVLLIPFFYVFFFLKAFWNPYDKISNIPVAIINLDKGLVGKEIVSKLEENNVMKIIKLHDDEEAKKMLKLRKVYSSITIPKKFTQSIENLESDEIIFRSNKKYNYIASQIYQRAAIEIEKTVENQISSTIIEKLHKGMEVSVNNINKLDNGLLLLDKGASKLYNGTKNLDNKYLEFDGGIDKLDKGIDSLQFGVIKYINGVNKSVEGLDALSKGVIRLGNKVKILKLSRKFRQLYNGAKKVQNKKIKEEINSAGIQVEKGFETLKQGSIKLKNASNEVKNGIHKIKDGSQKVNLGIKEAYNSVSKSSKIANKKMEELKNLDNYVNDSIKLKIENIDDVPNYGSVFASYFMSISLWVGALVIMVVMYYDAKKRFVLFDRNYDNKYLQYGCYLLLVIFQAIILTFLITKIFDFELLNMKILLLTMIVTDLAFFSIIYFFISLFDDFGKFISVILLIIQISASAGTFPIETAPEMFIKIFPIIPMKYSVSLFKEAFASYDKVFFIPNFLFIIKVFGLFSFLTLINIYIKKKVTKGRAK